MAKKKWNIRSIFFEEEPVQRTKTTPDSGNITQEPRASRPDPAPASPPSDTSAAEKVTMEGQVSDKFVKVLMAAMEAVNLPGFDYLEYKKSLQNLKKMNFTEDVRFQTAYAAAQSMGVTPGQLTDSAQHYLRALQKEQTKFAQALTGQKAQQVSQKETELRQLAASTAQQEQKIKALQAEIAQTRKRQAKLKEEIERSTAKLDKTRADFETTLRVLTEGIHQDVTKMKQYLK